MSKPTTTDAGLKDAAGGPPISTKPHYFQTPDAIEERGGSGPDVLRIPQSDLFSTSPRHHSRHAPSCDSGVAAAGAPSAKPPGMERPPPARKPQQAEDRAQRLAPETEPGPATAVGPQGPQQSDALQHQSPQSQAGGAAHRDEPAAGSPAAEDRNTQAQPDQARETGDTGDQNPFVTGPAAAFLLGWGAGVAEQAVDKFDWAGALAQLFAAGSPLWAEEMEEGLKQVREDFGIHQIERIQRDAELQAAAEHPYWAATGNLSAGTLPGEQVGTLARRTTRVITKRIRKKGAKVARQKIKRELAQAQRKRLIRQSRRRAKEILGDPADIEYGRGTWWETHIQPFLAVRKTLPTNPSTRVSQHDAHHLLPDALFRWGPDKTKGLRDFIPSLTTMSPEHRAIHEGLNPFLKEELKFDINVPRELSRAELDEAIKLCKQYYAGVNDDIGEAAIEAIQEFEAKVYKQVR